ncbi:uncharacterized protein mRpL35 [Centruroides vittatus]|uniref:uncharacterized protein mRpL35 n=1 Tax=Centruroides vittatus TaxID=120091 RepID=UPI00350EC408
MAVSVRNILRRSTSFIGKVNSFACLHYKQTNIRVNRIVEIKNSYSFQFKPFSTNFRNIQESKPVISLIPYMSSFLQPRKYDMQISRNVTKYSLVKGKRKTVKAVKRRFLRLNSGYWIRPKSGRAKRLHKKSAGRRYRLRWHVFCNAKHSKILDKMVSAYWKRPRYYVDDPYNPYQERHGLLTSFSRRKRWHEKN